MKYFERPGFVALTYSDFRFYLIARFLVLCAHQMLIVALAQYIYHKTNSTLNLGYIGLALFLPKAGFTFFAGHIADHFNRRKVILVCRTLQFFTVCTLLTILKLGILPLWGFYLLLAIIGSINTFEGPSSQAFVTQLVPLENFSNAVAWNSSMMQVALISGPALSGLLYAASGSALFVLGVVAAFRLAAVFLVLPIKNHPLIRQEAYSFSLKTLLAGLHYVFKHKIILGAISLDLFAVLFGGAVALMPVFANEILKVGPWGLGLLRAAPSVGAALMALYLAHAGPMKKPGVNMFASVFIFGMMTLCFGLSKNFYLSFFCLFILGAADMISVVIRSVLVQTKTPPEMRGRVSAVNLVFVGASNELGEFESGLTAHWLGTVNAVLVGGIGTLIVVVLWSWLFPSLRKYRNT